MINRFEYRSTSSYRGTQRPAEGWGGRDGVREGERESGGGEREREKNYTYDYYY